MLPDSYAPAFSRLIALRWGFLLLAALGLGLAVQDGMALPWLPMLAVLAALALVNGFSQLLSRRRPVERPWAVAAALALDCTILGILLFFSGGANNPLVTLYLLPLVFAALVLPVQLAWLLAGLAVVDYTFLMEFFIPLPGSAGERRPGL